MIPQVGPNVIGKHKIPKYLYHITKTSNLKSIQEKGLQTGEDEFFGEGVFLFDMANVVKFWKNRVGVRPLQEKLLEYTSGYCDYISLLKIPTEEIDKSKLVVRRLDTMMNLSREYYDDVAIFEAYAKGEIPKEIIEHITEGTPAVMSRKLENYKIPLEYIYPQSIPADKLSVIGNGYVPPFSFTFKSVMKPMLKGQPEEKMLDTFA